MASSSPKRDSSERAAESAAASSHAVEANLTLAGRARDRRRAVEALIARKRQLKQEIAATRAASNKKRQQLEILAHQVPEIGERDQPLRRLELLSELVDSDEHPNAVNGEVAELRTRLTAERASVSPRQLGEAAKACVGSLW